MKQTYHGRKCAYLAYDGRYFKIGESSNPEQRIKNMRTANPSIELITWGYGDTEANLHQTYKHRKIGGEWFDLKKQNVKAICKRIEQVNPSDAFGKQYDEFMQNLAFSYVVSFGKYRGDMIVDFYSEKKLKYLQWAIDEGDGIGMFEKSLFKWWLWFINYYDDQYIEEFINKVRESTIETMWKEQQREVDKKDMLNRRMLRVGEYERREERKAYKRKESRKWRKDNSTDDDLPF
jgi:uncharacterized protein (DUF3820 family)